MTTLFALLIIMILLVVGTTKWGLHPFLSLLLAALAMGFVSGLDTSVIITTLTQGFGNTLKSIGIVIACGTIIGTFLERNGGAPTIAGALLRVVGDKHSPLAMSITGFIVSIPVFCDSGFVILSTLNKAISKRTGLSLAVLAVALGTGLLATHVFVPPTPGPLAAAVALDADLGLVLVLGLLVSIPVVLAGLAWATYYCAKFDIAPEDLPETKAINIAPAPLLALVPILMPIVLIALKSVAEYPAHPFGIGGFAKLIGFLGNPVIALLLGVFAAFVSGSRTTMEERFNWVGDGLKSAGIIILITGAGGAFGNILRATDISDTISGSMVSWELGIILPFLIAAVLKTAQGSSTVAIITT
ncbi:MAG: GntP family permease, partial [Gammaproteobacteria bacterium]|nr:GntP family permease [Gammaproteobacteria bacterium]